MISDLYQMVFLPLVVQPIQSLGLEGALSILCVIGVPLGMYLHHNSLRKKYGDTDTGIPDGPTDFDLD